MCLPDFIEFRQIEEQNAIVGYRVWLTAAVNTQSTPTLRSLYRDYRWNVREGPHEVTDMDSGIYAYNHNNYNYNYLYNINYNYNNYNYNNPYSIGGVIVQYGKVALHSIGQRSEYAKVRTLFSIRDRDAQGPKAFLEWIGRFNAKIADLATVYRCDVMSWQDSVERGKQ